MMFQNVLYSAVYSAIIFGAHHVNTGFTSLPRKKTKGKPCLFDINQRFAFAIYGELERFEYDFSGMRRFLQKAQLINKSRNKVLEGKLSKAGHRLRKRITQA